MRTVTTAACAVFVTAVLVSAPAAAETLRVMATGLGTGTVQSTPAGINCADCDGTFANGTSVTLTHSAGSGSTFAGWNDDDCTGLGSCSIVMSSDRSIRPQFDIVGGVPPISAGELADPGLLHTYITTTTAVNSPARFVAALSDDFRQNWIMMSRSESLQTGNADTPRFLLPSVDARYVFTFGLKEHDSFPGAHPNAIEFMQWDPVDKNFRFHEIVVVPIGPIGAFPARGRGVSIDDARCSKCHSTRNVINRSAFRGTEPGMVKAKNKPNWDTYDSWGGMLPFNRDRVYQGSIEAAAIRRIFNPWTWRADPEIRRFIEQLQLQPTPTPAADLIERVQGGLDDGRIRFAFDGGAVVTSEPAPMGTPQTIGYSFDNEPWTPGTGTTVQRDGSYVRLHHSAGPSLDEGRGVQLFDLLAGADGNLNQQRIGDELANHRYATGSVELDARPVALAITKDCFTRNATTDTVTPMPAAGLSFFTARHGGMTINGVYDDTLERARSMPRRKADIQRFNLDRTDDPYRASGTSTAGLIQQYGAATDLGAAPTMARLRQEVFQRPRDLGVPDETNVGRIYVDREDHSPNTGSDFNTERLALYRYFLEPLGVSVDKWSIGVRGRSRTYTFADVFDDLSFYPDTITDELEASLDSDPFPGLSSPYTCSNLMTAVNQAFMSLPAASARPTFTDVQRIFNKGCIECHGGLDYPPFSEYFPATYIDFSEDEDALVGSGPPTGDERLQRSYDMAIRFTQPVVADSTLFRRITQAGTASVPEEQCPFGMMPCGGPRLSRVDIETIRRWIEGGRLYTHGDPHIRTIDGTGYDFQSAGEFVLLRGMGLEIQARQTPVETGAPLGPNPHTGLSTCVSINTAAAIRVGRHRISYQPTSSGEGSRLQLRVDGKPVKTLGARGIHLSTGGRVLPTSEPGGVQIQYAGGTDIVLTPGWWNHRQLWYLNIDVRHARATEGVSGRIAPGDWLPALPDGTSLGPGPASLLQRYQDLYETFADAWRVSDASSLFDYEPGTGTADFTVDAWPGNVPQSCDLPPQVVRPVPDVPPLPPLPLADAQQACAALAEPDHRANCEADVMVTGDRSFANTYLATERVLLNPIPPAAELSFPEDNALDLDTRVSFTWEKTQDVEGDRLVYMHCLWLSDEVFTYDKCEDRPRTNVLLDGNNLYLTLLVLIILLVLVAIAIVRASSGRKRLILLAVAILIAIALVLYFGTRTTMSTTATELEPGKAYSWKVITDDGHGGTSESQTWRFATRK